MKSLTFLQTIPLCLAFSMYGCTWISDKDYADQLSNVDDDGDGQTIAEGDCNDQNPNVSSKLPEIWYDGIDSDCGGDNDFDQDKDGYVPTEHQGKMTTSHVEVLPLPGGDCNDEDINSHPNADDEWYDGIDSDCGGEDDYDKDKDGYVPSEYEGLYTDNLVDQVLGRSGDCNDNNSSINPGKIDDWYDGIDSDCGGENDYDQDGDGFAYELIGSSVDVGDVQRGDCNDTNPNIFPTQMETWYDGTDADCAEDDDYDQDKDGYVPTQYRGRITQGVSGTGSLPGGDCDDLNAQRYEGAWEIIGSAQDYDCDLCVDTDCSASPTEGGDSFYVNESEWLIFTSASNPRNIRLASNSDTLFVSSRANDVTTINPNNGTTINYYSTSYVASFDLQDMSTDPTEFFRWRGKTDSPDTNPYTPRQSVVSNDDYFIGVIGQDYLNASGQSLYRQLRVSVKQLSQTFYYHLGSRTTGSAPSIQDVSVFLDNNDNIHAVGCEATSGLLQYVRTPLNSLLPGQNIDIELEKSMPNMFFSRCEIMDMGNGTGKFVGYNNGMFSEYSFSLSAADSNTLQFTSLGNAGYTHPNLLEWTVQNTGNDIVVMYTDATGVYADINGTQYLISNETNALHAYGVIDENGYLVVGMVDSSEHGRILIGDVASFTPASVLMDTYYLTTDGYKMREVVPYPYTDVDGNQQLFVSFLATYGISPKMGFGLVHRQ